METELPCGIPGLRAGAVTSAGESSAEIQVREEMGGWGQVSAAQPGKGLRASGAGLRFRCRPRGAGFAPHPSPAAHPGVGMELAPRGRGAAAVPGACGFQQTPSGQRPAAAQECRAQQVSAAVLTVLLRVPITAEMLPRSSRPQSISSRSF